MRSVRIPALLSIINRGARPFTQQDRLRVRRVGYEFAVRADLHQDDANHQRDLGIVRMLMGLIKRNSSRDYERGPPPESDPPPES